MWTWALNSLFHSQFIFFSSKASTLLKATQPTLSCIQATEQKAHLYWWCMSAKSLQLHLTLCDPVDVAHQASLSMRFSRQEYWGGLLCPSPGDLPDPRIKPVSPVTPALWVDSLLLSHQGSLRSLWNSPSQNIGVGSLSLVQGIFPTQGLNPGLPGTNGSPGKV